MRVLLSNDDGLRAPGLVALHEAVTVPQAQSPLPGTLDSVLVVAPLTVQSATSHGVTFMEPLMTQEVRVTERMNGIAVDGRPADCVKLALSSIWPEHFGAGTRPDLLLSGMNMGANCGVNIIYSGTVAAAIEGAFLGIPSIAVSLHLGRGQALYDVAARHARVVIDHLVQGGLAPHTCININLPVTEAEGPLPPVQVCPMNTHGLIDQYERRVNPAGATYYWASGGGLDFHGTDEGSDVDLLFRGCITVTPLRYDLTRRRLIDFLAGRLVGLPSLPPS